jgi:parvulin-like peptidyl-prolyl isomerase
MRARTWSLATLVGAAVLAVGPAWAPAQAPAAQAAPAAPRKPAAVVNGEPIAMAELETVLNQLGPQPVQLPEAAVRQRRLEVLGMMMDDLLIQQFLRTNGPRVDASEVNKKLAEAAEAMKKKGKNLQDFLREQGETEAQLRMEATAAVQWQEYVRVRLTPEELKHYYNENKDFFDQVQVRASHIVLVVPANATDAERQKLRDKLLAIRQEIVSGKLDFGEAAKKYSQCPSAPSGGDIGRFPRKGLVDEAFARAAFALPVGQVSDVVQSSYGLHLIKVTERTPPQPSDFNKIQGAVRDFAAEDMRQNLLVQLRRSAKIEINLP